MNPALWQRVENALVAGVVIVGFVSLGFAWWWLLVWFLVFDLSMVGYLRNTRLGALTYNAVHHYGPPAVLFGLFLVTDVRVLAFIGLLWGFHVAIDRALGYGLKYSDNFAHTHLGWLQRQPASQAQANPDSPEE